MIIVGIVSLVDCRYIAWILKLAVDLIRQSKSTYPTSYRAGGAPLIPGSVFSKMVDSTFF